MKDYAPSVFKHIRSLFGIRTEDYVVCVAHYHYLHYLHVTVTTTTPLSSLLPLLQPLLYYHE
jgi:hypothetical protein